MAQIVNPDLSVGPTDIRMDQNSDGGYILVIRAKPDIQSIIITESTADPNKKLDTYTLRAKEFNPVNGNEKKKLDGKFIETPGMYFLMSSTPQPDVSFGQVFRIFVPYVVVFGFPSSRYGELSMTDGAYLNIRSFQKPYADYSGAWKDNPYTIKLTQKANETHDQGYNKEAVKAFERFSRTGKGQLRYSKGEADLLACLKTELMAIPAGPMDVALCLDATKSMENDAPYLRQELVPLVQAYLNKHPGSRFGIVQFRDYMEDFLYKITPFTTDVTLIQNMLKDYYPGGGRDTPEAVNEGLYASLTELAWSGTSGLVILVGDAPPHPVARGSVDFDMVSTKLQELKVRIQAIILPD